MSRDPEPGRRHTLMAWVGGLGLWGGAAHGMPGTIERMLVGFSPGGTADLAARALCAALHGLRVAEVRIENRSGAGGRLALEHLRGGPTDGSVAVLTPDASICLYPHVFRTLRYDPTRDFQPVARVASLALAMWVGPLVPGSVASVADFVAWARSQRQPVAYGTPAAGATPHFVGAMLSRATGLDLVPVHYRGGAAGLQDLAGRHLPVFFGAVQDGLALQRDNNRIRALATSGAQRSAALPGVPTFAEQGHADLTAEDGLGVHLPAAVPRPAVDLLAASLQQAMEGHEVGRVYASIGLDRAFEGPDAYARRLQRDSQHWQEAVRETGFKALEDR